MVHSLRPSTIIVGTRNKGKFSEIAGYAATIGLAVVGIDDVSHDRGQAPRVAETGTSIEENVALKARAYSRWSGLPVLVDDTGLFLESLGGLPGVYTADWGLARVVAALGPSRSSFGVFRCCMAFAEPSGRLVTAEGAIHGDFRYDPEVIIPDRSPLPFSYFFCPAGFNTPLSTLHERGFADSHRARAFNLLAQSLGWTEQENVS